MYQLKSEDDKNKMLISDHEFDLLPAFKKTLYEPYVRKTERPEYGYTLNLTEK